VPVLNKIDLPTADVDRVKKEIEAVIGIDAEDAVAISAKTGLNVVDVLEAIVQRIPPPKPRDTDKLQALIIDSWFDNYLGVVSLVRVMQGELVPGTKMLVMSTGRTHQVEGVGVFTPKRKPLKKLGAGEVGWITASIKDVHGAPVGDTLTLAVGSCVQALARLPGNAAARVRRPVPGGCRGLPGAARSAGKTAPQRRRAAFRTGKLRGDGLRFPLRLPRHAAPGNRAGAPGARIRPQPDHHRADGDLRSAQDRRHRDAAGQPGQAAADQPHRRNPRADHPRQRAHAAGLRRQRDHVCARKSAARRSASRTWAARCRSATSCRWPKWCWTSSIA
jgi:hypothetical protein